MLVTGCVWNRREVTNRFVGRAYEDSDGGVLAKLLNRRTRSCRLNLEGSSSEDDDMTAVEEFELGMVKVFVVFTCSAGNAWEKYK